MATDSWRSSMRGWGHGLVVLGCVLLGAPALGQDAGGALEQEAQGQDAGGALVQDPDAGVPQAAVDAVPATQGQDAGGPQVDSGVVVPLHGVPVTVTASSVLADPKDPGRYGPANLLDEDPGTIWAEGAKGTGAGAWVELSFPPDTPVHAFLVTPGNPKSVKLYKANARPRKARLELKLAEGRKLDYVLDFPRDFPAGGAIYIDYSRQFAVHSARLTVLTAWPGSRYRDLCLGGFIPVFRGPPERVLQSFLNTFLGTGTELAPTLAEFMDEPLSVDELLPPDGSGTSAWLRAYSRVPHDGPLPTPEWELDVARSSIGEWDWVRRVLARQVAGANLQSQLFRLTPVPGGRGYVFDPISPPKRPDSFENFRIHWAFVQGAWRVVGLDTKYREQTPDD